MLDTNRHAHHIGGDARRYLFLGAELLVRRRCRMNDERFASPTLARWLASFTLSMNFTAFS